MRKVKDLENFAPEDGNYLERWDLFEPLFDNFYILGPEVFNSSSEPICLFQYPLKYHKIIKETANSNSKPNAQFQINIDNTKNQLSKFLFPDGIHFIENDENYRIIDSSYIDTLSKPPKVYDHIILIKSEGNIPHYYFCLRFRCSPFSRPAAFNFDEFESLINEFDEFDYDNNYLNEKAKNFYLEKMKKYFMNDFILYQSTKICPSCLFAYCFETKHPFHDLYYKLIKSIVYIESSGRAMAINLHNIINHMVEENLPLGIPKQRKEVPNNDNDNDDSNDSDNFILINKIASQNIFESESIISIQDLNESKGINHSPKLQNTGNAKNPFQVQDIDILEKIIVDKNDPNFSWPENSFNSRDTLLEILYNETVLPEIGEEMFIRINRSSFSKFMWKRPTIEQYCIKISTFGIKSLLEWITLDDFIRLLSLIFLENSIIVYGTEMELIYRLVTALSHLIFPFSWPYLILTIIPESKLGLLESPIPFIAGLFKNEKVIDQIRRVKIFDDILIVDIEDRRIIWPKKERPKIACFYDYHNSLLPFCTKKENQIDHSNLYKRYYPDEIKSKKSEVILIHEDKNSPNKMPVSRRRRFSFNISINNNSNLYFNLNKISEIVETVFKNNRDVFASKIQPAIVTRVKRDELDTNGSEAIGSMLVDELYLSQFNKKNDHPFVIEFMQTQMFITYRQLACRLRSDVEVDSLHLVQNTNTSSKMKDDQQSIMSGFDVNKK